MILKGKSLLVGHQGLVRICRTDDQLVVTVKNRIIFFPFVTLSDA